MKKLLPLLLVVFGYTGMAQTVATPDKVFGDLFVAVQMNKVFPDGKTFVDCVPKRKPKDIMYDYGMMKGPNFDLKKFVEDNFEIPKPPQLNYVTKEKDVTMHIKNLWGVLKRQPDKPVEGSSLLPLPNPYIVPGGRFGEIYYWDSYFTMLGLQESGETEMIENMIKNFAFLIDTYGHIPNGNRSYYLSRSQPPFFSVMVELLAEIKGDKVYQDFLPQMEKEYRFFMEGAEKLKPGEAYRRVVKLKDGTVMNRYWDDSDSPRQESYKEDVETADIVVKDLMSRAKFKSKSAMQKTEKELRSKMYRNLRAGAESGIDFSSRWFDDKKSLTTIRVTDMIAVDLNSLLYHLEQVLKLAYTKAPANGPNATAQNLSKAGEYDRKAQQRKKAIDAYCWNESMGMYTDYDIVNLTQTDRITMAGMYPLFFKVADKQRAEKQKNTAVKNLLKPGGFSATTEATGQQWDAPNGWAPLVWIGISGLEKNGFFDDAREAANRWIQLNTDVFARTGKLMEKYNVADTHLEAGGGEYPSQDGFGWTNGVLLKLMAMYKGK